MSDLKRILVVDNEKIVADTLVLVMRKGGFAASACYSGQEAVEAAREFRPDLLLTDFEMPFLNGMQAALQVTAHHPECRVVFLSAMPDSMGVPDDMWRSRPDFLWIEKPVLPDVLLRRLEESLRSVSVA